MAITLTMMYFELIFQKKWIPQENQRFQQKNLIKSEKTPKKLQIYLSAHQNFISFFWHLLMIFHFVILLDICWLDTNWHEKVILLPGG